MKTVCCDVPPATQHTSCTKPTTSRLWTRCSEETSSRVLRQTNTSLCNLANDCLAIFAIAGTGTLSVPRTRTTLGIRVSQSQVQPSGTVYQPPWELQLSPHWRSLDIWRRTCSADRQRVWGTFMMRSTNLLIIIINSVCPDFTVSCSPLILLIILLCTRLDGSPTVSCLLWLFAKNHFQAGCPEIVELVLLQPNHILLQHLAECLVFPIPLQTSTNVKSTGMGSSRWPRHREQICVALASKRPGLKDAWPSPWLWRQTPCPQTH